MQRVNAEYANRVTKVLGNAIGSLKNCSAGDGNQGPPPFDTSSLVNELESLRDEISDTLSLTLVDDESLRSDIRKFECERFTKNRELVKLRAKLRDMREEREERRVELESELSELKAAFEEKKAALALATEQERKRENKLSELEKQKEAFEKEWNALKEKRDRVCKEYEDQRHRYGDDESKLQANLSSIKMDIQKLSCDHDMTVSIKRIDIQSEQAQLEQQKRRRCELEEHFRRVDMNNVMKMREEEKLRRVCELEEQAMALLAEGAIGLQKLWRGMKERELVAKMKSKKKKKDKKGGKKKKS
mmetsp:Transcript_17388/g.36464  ORF Transcript_17388/g.36464 Transcript_17388/m.36464 type:complete len:303 (+) Transcript_17388:80-988(+)